MYTCASCNILSCGDACRQNMPTNCPMQNRELNQEALSFYAKPECQKFYITSSEIEAIGYGKWPRLLEVIEFSKCMNYKKVGLAFCRGLRKEAKVINTILKSHGFDVVSVICKTGGISKEKVGIAEEHKINPGEYEAMCNPLAQAMLLNEQKTEFNIAVGLCVGHDSLFYKYSNALVTTLISKDRVLAHNPVGAIYCADGYYKDKLNPARGE